MPKRRGIKKSKYLETKALAKLKQDDWLKADIEKRNEDIYQTLRNFFLENL
ncbi:hypothetical protein [Helicobacter ailurogastricus]|uniref:hypothetical protein n=1 Tax=Helicobacter ailurogastricus TaxID=1578720 RepID=UPI0013153700|nr:hypothetical protein [Helicobacter ailurogastricus]